MKKLVVCLSLIGFVFVLGLVSGCGMGGSELVGSQPPSSNPDQPANIDPANEDDPEAVVSALSVGKFPDENKSDKVLKVPEEYATIAEAVAAATDGNIILLAEGTFPLDENFKIEKKIQLVGSGSKSIITGPQENSLKILFDIEDDVIIKDLKINAPNAVALYLYDSKSVIKNVEIEESMVGIHAGGSSIVKFLGNKILADETIKVGDNAVVFAKDNILNGKGNYRNVSIVSDGSLYARGNIIEASENCDDLIIAEKNSTVDLGLKNGKNTFILKNINGNIIKNKTSKNIPTQGNFWSKLIYKEMTTHPDPYASDANITKIYDWHDDSTYGIVDYKNFKIIHGEEEDPHADGVLKVPAEFATIQSAVNEARSGETVLVSDGTYKENIVIDYGITLTAENDQNDIKPIIEGSSSVNTITIKTNENQNSALAIEGFSIKNGSVGIYVENISGKSLKIHDNEISNCSRAAIENSSALEGEILISNNSIHDNGRGGIWLDSSSTKLTSEIKENKAFKNRSAGIYVKGGEYTFISNNDIFDNYSYGSAISVMKVFFNVEKNICYRNDAYGIYVEYYDVEKNVDPTIKNNTFYANQFGVAIANATTKPVVIENNISMKHNGEGFIYNADKGLALIKYNDCFNNWCGKDTGGDCSNFIPLHNPENYNISKDPKFVNPDAGDFNLQAGSPCIDVGNPNDAVPTGGGSRIDIGAFEYVQ